MDINQLQEIYEEEIDKSLSEKEQIYTLLETVEQSVGSHLIAGVTGCSFHCVYFEYDEEVEEVVEKEWVKELSEIYEREVDTSDTYEEQIRTLLETAEGVNSVRVAKIIGCSVSYARRFKYDENVGKAVEKDWSEESQNEKVSPGARTRIVRRDGEACLRCGDRDSLEVHHIIPVSDGGEKEDDNLATLCESCHKKAHGGSFTTPSTVYETEEEFNSWLEETESSPGAMRGIASSQQTTLFDY